MTRVPMRYPTLYPGFDFLEGCGWCLDGNHERCCWEGCACVCRPRRWLRFRRWLRRKFRAKE